MVHHPQVAEFVHHHIVDHILRKMDQAPVQPYRAIHLGTAPACVGTAQAQFLPLHLQLRRKVVQALLEIVFGLAHQPGLHRIPDLVRLGGQRQSHFERS